MKKTDEGRFVGWLIFGVGLGAITVLLASFFPWALRRLVIIFVFAFVLTGITFYRKKVIEYLQSILKLFSKNPTN